jgi:hypothetical protein
MARHRHAARIAERASPASKSTKNKKRARSASPEPTRTKRAKKERSPSPVRKSRSSKYITEEESEEEPKKKKAKKASLAKPMKKKKKAETTKKKKSRQEESEEEEESEQEEEEQSDSDQTESDNDSDGGYIREPSRRSQSSKSQQQQQKKKAPSRKRDEDSDNDEEEARLVKREAQRSKFKQPMSSVLPEKDGGPAAAAAAGGETARRLSTAEKAALRRIHDRSFARKLSGKNAAKIDDLHLKISSAKAMHKMLLMEICPEACHMATVVDPNDKEKKVQVKRVDIHMGDPAVQCLSMAAADELINHVLPAALTTTLSNVSTKKIKPEDADSKEHLLQQRLTVYEKARLNRKIEPRAMDAAFRTHYANNPILMRRYNELCKELDDLHDAEMVRERVRSQADREYADIVKRLEHLDKEEQKLIKTGGLSEKEREEQLTLKIAKRSYEKKKATASMERALHAIDTAEKMSAVIREKIPELEAKIQKIDKSELPAAIKAEKKAASAFETRRAACKDKEEEIKEMREELRAEHTEQGEEGLKNTLKILDEMRKDKKQYQVELEAARSKVRVLNNTKARSLKSIETQKLELEACKARVLRNTDIVEEKKTLIKQRTQQLATLSREKKKNHD